MKSATGIFTSTFGALIGLAGLEHGIGEILQGNVAPAGLMIESWPDSAFFSSLGGEPAMTIVPNLLVTGILAVFVSLAMLAWSALFLRRKNGGLALVLISIVLLLVGGGIFPPILGILAGVIAAKINSPLTWWRSHLPESVRRIMAALWPWSFAACVLSWFALIPGIAVLGYFFGVDDTNLILILLGCLFGSLLLTSLAGLARDSLYKEKLSTVK